jgi:hypothetical protein
MVASISPERILARPAALIQLKNLDFPFTLPRDGFGLRESGSSRREGLPSGKGEFE